MLDLEIRLAHFNKRLGIVAAGNDTAVIVAQNHDGDFRQVWPVRWDKAREKAQQNALEQGDPMLAAKIGGFQFRDIRPKAVSEIIDIGDASLLLGHSKQEITKRVYRRIGATAKPSK